MKAISRLKDSGLSLSQMADRLGCTYHTLRNYQTGRRFPSEEQFARLVQLGQERGVELSAADFVLGAGDVAP